MIFIEHQIIFRMIFEGSCDHKDWRNDAENQLCHYKIISFIFYRYIKIESFYYYYYYYILWYLLYFLSNSLKKSYLHKLYNSNIYISLPD